MDGTYKTNVNQYALYTILVEDNYGVGQPVCYFLLLTETTEAIMAGLEIFRSHNDVSRTKVVVTDKDCKELISVKQIFPNAISLLCQFHVLNAVSRRLKKAKLQEDYEEEIFKTFQDTLHERNDRLVIERKRDFLCNIAEDDLGNYFKIRWFKKPEMWCSIDRTHLFTKANNTTNRLERFHSTIKSSLNHKQALLHDLVETLVRLIELRILGRGTRELESKIKFLKVKPPAILVPLSKKITSFALKLVEKELAKPTTSYAVFEENTEYVVTTNDEEHKVLEDLSQCSCSFFCHNELPCTAICYIAKTFGMELPIERYNSCWNIDSNQSVAQKYPIINGTENISQTVVRRPPQSRKPVRREDLWSEANSRAKILTNAMSNLSKPAFDGYMAVMDKMIESISTNTPLILTGSELRGTSIQSSSQQPITPLLMPTISSPVDFGTPMEVDELEPIEAPNMSCPSPVVDINPAIALKRKSLHDLHLGEIKRRAGRPRPIKQLAKYKYIPKAFVKKRRSEQARLFLSWYVGSQKAEELLNTNTKAEESHLMAPEDVPSAVLEEDVTSILSTFQYLFTPEAWESVLATIDRKKRKQKYICPFCNKSIGTDSSILCDSCLLWTHKKCANLKGKGSGKAEKYMCYDCRKLAKI